MPGESSFIQMNIHFLSQGKQLLATISDDAYRFNESPYFNSSAGKHIRHVLDHYESLLRGVHTKVDYDDRQRNTRIEIEREYAVKVFGKHITELETLLKNNTSFDDPILVRSNELDMGEESSWTNSSLNRELQFLIGHTVHHYALIAFILRVQNYSPPRSFGRAPSTLKYERQKAQKV